MDELDAWLNFVTTGSVLDYLKYSSIKNSTQDNNPREEPNEIHHGRTDYTRTEYKGTGQTGNRTDKK